MRTRQEVIDFCLSLDDTYEDYPLHDFNWTVMRHKGNQKMKILFLYLLRAIKSYNFSYYT